MTISNADLDSAVREGLISDETAMALRLHALNRGSGRAPAPAKPETGEAEHFRLLSGFNDVFVVVALCVLLGALAGLVTRLVSSASIGFGVAAAAAFALSVYFAHMRRMALPSLALAAWFAVATCVAVAIWWAVGKDGIGGALSQRYWPALALIWAATLHGAIFRVPVNAALVAVGVVLLFRVALGPLQAWHEVLLGLLLLASAVALDAGDRLRRGLRSDAAFWLHLVAAPVLVAGLFGLLSGADRLVQGLGALGLYACLVLMALVLDRRAPLVSGLFYVLSAVWVLFVTKEGGGDKSLVVAGSALVIASALLLLAAGWTRARALVLRGVPAGWRAALPPA